MTLNMKKDTGMMCIATNNTTGSITDLSESIEQLSLSKDAITSSLDLNSAGDRPNKNIKVIKPIEISPNTGEVLVRKSTGKTKLRKGQSQVDYLKQKHKYLEIDGGPTVKEENYLLNSTFELVHLVTSLEPALAKEGVVDTQEKCDLLVKTFSDKQQRALLNYLCNSFYYQKKYSDCYSLASKLVKSYHVIDTKNRLKKEIEELERLCTRAKDKARGNAPNAQD
ncbi:uncharacterized protein SCODWIG_02672 [Saccharomycodes ludwigii]|uniref:Uncharacterized protein n=1 Tax=Saccharomycodes ludwigii TaxID=36035 RepID=A0A376B8H2_9ASCO|nr:uncharacterized protein SCODWIG_02672 [Saccharomycodes ludwigii]